MARPTGVAELGSGPPRAAAAENARRKALAGAAQAAAGELVLGVDTLVTIDGEVIGKPADATEALAVLARLAGRAHEVLGGLALARDGALVAEALEATEVRFRALPDATLRWYVATGEWQGRAGGYAVQGAGAALVAGLQGDYLNVVGLPLARLLELRPELLETG